MKKIINKLQKKGSVYKTYGQISTLRKTKSLKYASLAIIICCIIINYFNFTQLLQVAFDTPDAFQQNTIFDIYTYIKPLIFSLFLTGLLIISPIFLGKAFFLIKTGDRKRIYVLLFIWMFIITLLFILTTSWFRYSIEVNQCIWIYGDSICYPAVISILYTLIMITGVFVLALYAYFKKKYERKFIWSIKR